MEKRNQNDIDILKNASGRYDAHERAERLSRNRQSMLESGYVPSDRRAQPQKSAGNTAGDKKNTQRKAKVNTESTGRKPKTAAENSRQKESRPASPSREKNVRPQAQQRTAAYGRSSDGELMQTRSERAKLSAQMRKKRKKRRDFFIISIFILMLASAVCILSATVLFNAEKINVENSALRYTDEQIITASGISAGDNMIRMNVDKLQKTIQEALPYIESALIKRSFPDTVTISVEYAAAALAAEQGGAFILMNFSGKVLESGAVFPNEGILEIKGADIVSAEPGKTIVFNEENSFALCMEITDSLSKNGISGVTALDISNLNDIKIEIDYRITVLVGSASDIGQKLAFGKEVIAENLERAKTSKLVIDLTDAKKAYVRTQENIDKMNEQETQADNNSDITQAENGGTETENTTTLTVG